MWPRDVEGARIEREVRAQSEGTVGGMSDIGLNNGVQQPHLLVSRFSFVFFLNEHFSAALTTTTSGCTVHISTSGFKVNFSQFSLNIFIH